MRGTIDNKAQEMEELKEVCRKQCQEFQSKAEFSEKEKVILSTKLKEYEVEYEETIQKLRQRNQEEQQKLKKDFEE